MSAVRSKPVSLWLLLTSALLCGAVLMSVLFMRANPELASFTDRNGIPYLVVFALISLGTRFAWARRGGARYSDFALIAFSVVSAFGVFSPVSSAPEIDIAGCYLLLAIYIGLFDACLEAFEVMHIERSVRK